MQEQKARSLAALNARTGNLEVQQYASSVSLSGVDALDGELLFTLISHDGELLSAVDAFDSKLVREKGTDFNSQLVAVLIDSLLVCDAAHASLLQACQPHVSGLV
jgi:hypothetical protein